MELGDEVTEKVLADWRTAPVSPRMRAALAFVEAITLRPDDLSTANVEAAKAAGLTEAAIEDAAWVSITFSVIDRVADTLGFGIASKREFARGARVLLKRGYRM